MQKHRGIAQDPEGNVITSATITVTDYPVGGGSTIYSDDGITPLANPFTSSATDGIYEFYAANGRYTVTAAKVGEETKQSTDVILFDPKDIYNDLWTSYVVANKAAAAALSLTSADDGRKVFVTSDDGGEFTVRYNATPSTYADDGGSYCGTQFIPSGGDGTIGIVRDYQGAIFAHWFGVETSASALTNTTGFQNAIDAANALTYGGSVSAKPGLYTIASAGLHDGRNHGLMLKDNVTLDFPGSHLCTIKSDASADMDVLITDRVSGPTTNIGIKGLTIDGNQANQTDAGGGEMNYWIYDADDVHVDDLFSVDPTGWGFRFEQTTDVHGGLLKCSHAANINADGVHFEDASGVSIDKVIINTAGDDGFVIGAKTDDSHDITIGELVVTTPVTVASAGRGILLLLANSADALSEQHKIYNINIKNAITYNCKGSALAFDKAEFYNINIDLTDYGSNNGLNIVIGSANVIGYLRNSEIKLKSWAPDQDGIVMSIVNGAIEYNRLYAQIYNPGDGNVGATLRGDYWDAHIQLDYDPLGTKVSQTLGIDVYGTNNEIHANVDGASDNIYLRATADLNTIYPINLQNATSKDINIVSGATDNRFIGGAFSSLTNNGTNTRFSGTKGGHNYGNASISPNANGNGTIAHGLAGTPNNVHVDIRGDNVNGVDVQSVDGTNITVRIKDAAGADVTAGSFTIDWEAKI